MNETQPTIAAIADHRQPFRFARQLICRLP